MKCPHCGATASQVVETRTANDNTIRRRRVCDDCGMRFTTYERVEYAMPKVIKKPDANGASKHDTFDREKIERGVRLAVGSTLSFADVQAIVDNVIERIQTLNVPDITSRHIGDIVMHEIGKKSRIGYMRFACEYLDMTDLSEVKALLQQMEQDDLGNGARANTP